jgi:Microtubule-associated tyrosine carboxypeptidase
MTSWVKSADRALFLAADHVKLIRAVTPTNFDSELEELERAFRRGSPRLPRWSYDGAAVPPELHAALEKLAGFLEGLSPLGAVYAARAREMGLEASIIDAVGTQRLRSRAEERFVSRTPEGREDLARADELATAWAAPAPGPEPPSDEKTLSSDVDDPSSLVSRMSSEVGKHFLPMRVVLQSGLASLAATGDGVILVASGKWVARRDVERTVLHEIAGHAMPRARAIHAPIGIFALGTAYGIDDQEGRALLIEESAGFLDAGRRRELGFRHIAARAALEGQNLVDVVRLLLGKGASVAEAVRIAARVERGGLGSGGLAREVVYLPAYLRVRRATCGPFAAVVERMMASGRIAADVARVVEKAVPGPQKEDVYDLLD